MRSGRRQVCLRSWVLAFAALLPAAAAGLTQPSASLPPPAAATTVDRPEEPLDLGSLIEQLGSPSYSEREQATATLKSQDKSLVDQIARHYPSLDNHEVRLRLREIAEHLFYREAIDHLGGFLGISLSAVVDQDDRQLQPGEFAVRVMEVLPGTAAEAGGLKVGDLIVGIDGHPLDGDRGDTSGFVELIGSMPHGTTIDLAIRRQARSLTATVTLGRKPLASLNRLRLQEDDRRAIERADQEFRQWWAGVAPAD